MNRSLPLTTFSPLLLVAALAAQAPQPPADAAAPVFAAHARGLLELAGKALDGRLLNDAERLRLVALRCDARVPGADGLEQKIHAALVASGGGDGREAVKAFWKSAASAKALQQLSESEAALRARCDQDLAAAARQVDDAAGLDAIVRRALERDLLGDALAGAAGKERTAKLRGEHDRAHSIDQLQLGDVVVGSPVDLAALRGKVVLWRSFSL